MSAMIGVRSFSGFGMSFLYCKKKLDGSNWTKETEFNYVSYDWCAQFLGVWHELSLLQKKIGRQQLDEKNPI